MPQKATMTSPSTITISRSNSTRTSRSHSIIAASLTRKRVTTTARSRISTKQSSSVPTTPGLLPIVPKPTRGAARLSERGDGTMIMRSGSTQIWRRCGTDVAGPVQSSANCSRRSQTATRRFSLQPNDAATLDSRGLIYLKMGQFDSAIQDYNSALRIEPKMASALYGRGLARLKKGRCCRRQCRRCSRKEAREPRSPMIFHLTAYAEKRSQLRISAQQRQH